MARPRKASRAWLLWGLSALALLAWLIPYQLGKLAEQALPGELAKLCAGLACEYDIPVFSRGWRKSQAQIRLSHPALREPVTLDLELRHGPWLGRAGLGLLAAHTRLPQEGGILPFPPHEAISLDVKVDLLGRARLSLWRQGELLGAFDLGRALACVIGEARLPGAQIKLHEGDVRLAEMELRMRLERLRRSWQGVVGMDARRAAWGEGVGAWLGEEPRIMLELGQDTALNLTLASIRGAAMLGPLDMRLRWQEVDWAALRASLGGAPWRLHDLPRLGQRLDRLGLALGHGEIVLEHLRLQAPAGRIELEGLLRGRDAQSGIRRLHLDLRLGIERPLALQLLRASPWVQDDAGAERLLATLCEQHILVQDGPMLRGALSLWDGALSLSGRPMLLEDVLAPPLNSAPLD